MICPRTRFIHAAFGITAGYDSPPYPSSFCIFEFLFNQIISSFTGIFSQMITNNLIVAHFSKQNEPKLRGKEKMEHMVLWSINTLIVVVKLVS